LTINKAFTVQSIVRVSKVLGLPQRGGDNLAAQRGKSAVRGVKELMPAHPTGEVSEQVPV